MPIGFDLEKIRCEYNCSNYFETGLWDPRDDISAKLALRPTNILKCSFAAGRLTL
jgi:hypothetical protein